MMSSTHKTRTGPRFKLTIRSSFALALVAISTFGLVRLASARTDRKVIAKELSFKLSSKSVAKAGTVSFKIKNAGHILHDFKINGEKTHLIKPGKAASLVVTFKKKGHYRYICTVPGHAAAGMRGVFTVR